MCSPPFLASPYRPTAIYQSWGIKTARMTPLVLTALGYPVVSEHVMTNNNLLPSLPFHPSGLFRAVNDSCKGDNCVRNTISATNNSNNYRGIDLKL